MFSVRINLVLVLALLLSLVPLSGSARPMAAGDPVTVQLEVITGADLGRKHYEIPHFGMFRKYMHAYNISESEARNGLAEWTRLLGDHGFRVVKSDITGSKLQPGEFDLYIEYKGEGRFCSYHPFRRGLSPDPAAIARVLPNMQAAGLNVFAKGPTCLYYHHPDLPRNTEIQTVAGHSTHSTEEQALKALESIRESLIEKGHAIIDLHMTFVQNGQSGAPPGESSYEPDGFRCEWAYLPKR